MGTSRNVLVNEIVLKPIISKFDSYKVSYTCGLSKSMEFLIIVNISPWTENLLSK